MRHLSIYLSLGVVLVLLAGLGAPITAAQGDVTVRTIDITGQLVQSTLSPDGSLLAVWENGAYHNNELILSLLPIQLVNLDTGDVTRLIGPTDYASDAAFSPDGSMLVTYHPGGWIFVWDTATGQEIRRIPAVPGMARVSFLPDGTLVTALPGPQASTVLWDVATGTPAGLLAHRYGTYAQAMDSMSRQAAGMSTMAFTGSPAGDTLLTVSLGGKIWLWDLATGDETLLRDGDDERPMLPIRRVTYTPDGTLIFYHNRDGLLYALDMVSGEETTLLAIEKVGSSVAITPDGSRAAWVDADLTSVQIVSLDAPDAAPQVIPLPETDLELRPSEVTNSLAFSDDGTRLALTGYISDDNANMVVVVDLD
jgi:WD40 repeat protein